MTQPERLILDSLRECELCPAPGFYALKVNDFIFNYCHNHFKECDIPLTEIDSYYSTVESQIKRLLGILDGWKRDD